MLRFLVKFINYWYFRYLLITELYMVEKWERVMIHIVLLIALSILSFFNMTVIMGLVSLMTQHLFQDNSLVDGNRMERTVGPSDL